MNWFYLLLVALFCIFDLLKYGRKTVILRPVPGHCIKKKIPCMNAEHLRLFIH